MKGQRLIGLMGALKEEVASLQACMQKESQETIGGMLFDIGLIAGVRVVLTQCGVGKVQAAMSTQLLIHHFGVTDVLFTGVAGAVQEDLAVGDVVIGTSCVQHDMNACALGFLPGEVPYANILHTDCCQDLQAHAWAAASHLQGMQVAKGRIVSGDQFIACAQKVTELRQVHNAVCVEMEGASVGFVCEKWQIPHVILRTLSDSADGSAHMDYPKFVLLAAETSKSIVLNMLSQIKEQDEA